MVSYEEAKKIALEILGDMAVHIDEAFETEDAYIFNDSKHIPNIYMRDGFLLLLGKVMGIVFIMVNICLVMIRHGLIRRK